MELEIVEKKNINRLNKFKNNTSTKLIEFDFLKDWIEKIKLQLPPLDLLINSDLANPDSNT